MTNEVDGNKTTVLTEVGTKVSGMTTGEVGNNLVGGMVKVATVLCPTV
jgi:hypothetical protein